MITKNDIAVGNKFQNKHNDIFEILKINQNHAQTCYIVHTSVNGRTGYCDVLTDLVDFLNEEECLKIIS